MIRIENLTYSYETKQGLSLFAPLTHTFDKSSIHVIRGPNGSGKSTLLRILATLMRPSSGKIFINQVDVTRGASTALRNKIAFSAGAPLGFYPRLDAYDNLRFFSVIKGTDLSRAQLDKILERVQLASSARTKCYQEYSLGMRQRLHLARLLISPNDFVLIDEITNGLDVQGIELCEQLLKSELAEKVRILVSHDQNFVAKLTATILELPGST